MEDKKTSEREYMTQYDLAAYSAISQQEKINEALAQGFEPFAVTNSMIEAPENRLAIAAAQRPKVVMETTIWFRRSYQTPLMTQAEIDAEKLTEFEQAQALREVNGEK